MINVLSGIELFYEYSNSSNRNTYLTFLHRNVGISTIYLMSGLWRSRYTKGWHLYFDDDIIYPPWKRLRSRYVLLYVCSTFILCNMYFPTIEVYVRNVLIVSTKQLLILDREVNFTKMLLAKETSLQKTKGKKFHIKIVGNCEIFRFLFGQVYFFVF